MADGVLVTVLLSLTLCWERSNPAFGGVRLSRRYAAYRSFCSWHVLPLALISRLASSTRAEIQNLGTDLASRQCLSEHGSKSHLSCLSLGITVHNVYPSLRLQSADHYRVLFLDNEVIFLDPSQIQHYFLFLFMSSEYSFLLADNLVKL